MSMLLYHYFIIIIIINNFSVYETSVKSYFKSASYYYCLLGNKGERINKKETHPMYGYMFAIK